MDNKNTRLTILTWLVSNSFSWVVIQSTSLITVDCPISKALKVANLEMSMTTNTASKRGFRNNHIRSSILMADFLALDRTTCTEFLGWWKTYHRTNRSWVLRASRARLQPTPIRCSSQKLCWCLTNRLLICSVQKSRKSAWEFRIITDLWWSNPYCSNYGNAWLPCNTSSHC